MLVVSVKIGNHCYHGLCDLGASESDIPFTLYQEIMNDIAPAEIEDIDVTIKPTYRDTITPLGIVNVEVLCGNIKYPTDFLFLGSPQDDFCPIIFGRPFLNIVNAKVDCEKQNVSVNFGDVSHEFNGLASIVVPPTDPLEQYLLGHENDMHLHERNKIDKISLEQQPILKHNFPAETLGGPPPPTVLCLN